MRELHIEADEWYPVFHIEEYDDAGQPREQEPTTFYGEAVTVDYATLGRWRRAFKAFDQAQTEMRAAVEEARRART